MRHVLCQRFRHRRIYCAIAPTSQRRGAGPSPHASVRRKGGRIGIDERGVAIPASPAWQVLKLADVDLPAGPGTATLRALDCRDCEIAELVLRRARPEPDRPFPRVLVCTSGRGTLREGMPMSMIAVFFGRLFIAVIFVVSGINKLIHVSDTSAMIGAAGLPGGLAIPVGLFELIAGVLPRARHRHAALVHPARGLCPRHHSLLSPRIYRSVQAMAAMKNLAIAGGLPLPVRLWQHPLELRRAARATPRRARRAPGAAARERSRAPRRARRRPRRGDRNASGRRGTPLLAPLTLRAWQASSPALAST